VGVVAVELGGMGEHQIHGLEEPLPNTSRHGFLRLDALEDSTCGPFPAPPTRPHIHPTTAGTNPYQTCPARWQRPLSVVGSVGQGAQEREACVEEGAVTAGGGGGA
jgi:hypothetical protein